jgi:imidazolonepropionase-like amidohydrolase
MFSHPGSGKILFHISTNYSSYFRTNPNADAAVAYLGVLNCRRLLNAGFTTVLDGGGNNFIEVALREAINKGYFDGPNYYVAGKQLTTNHAHFVGFSMEPFGPWGMRKAVRDLMWWGVDFVKMQLSPPIRMAGRNSQACDFTAEEIEAGIDEAHNYGVAVHAHLRGAQSIKRFLRAGGDVVVHGTGMDEEGIELMLKGNKYLLATLFSPTPNPSPELVAAKNKSVMKLLASTAQVHWDSARRAFKAGVKIALSTDAGALGIAVGSNAGEFLNLQKIGMSNLEALRTGTSEAAKAIGMADSIGRIAEGFAADIAILDGNPLEDLTATQRVIFTIKDGRVVKSPVQSFEGEP